jgi:DNA-binding NarL/FixJ family response regulator
MMIRVAIIDDNPTFRKELAQIIGKAPDIKVVADAQTDLAGIRKIEQGRPDVIVLDKRNPFTDGLETTFTIVSKFEKTRIIVLAMDSKKTIFGRNSKRAVTASFCQLGACFHLCQDCGAAEILAAIRNDHPLASIA